MRLIDADAVKDNINEWLDCVGNVLIGKGLSYTWELEGCIDDAPTIEAKPVKHGRWDDDHKCTVCRKEALCEQKPDPYACGLLTLFYVDSAYCPNCGARMDLEEIT